MKVVCSYRRLPIFVTVRIVADRLLTKNVVLSLKTLDVVCKYMTFCIHVSFN